jgi:molybdopterin-guanine dinucleotide biosynthesis protein A
MTSFWPDVRVHEAQGAELTAFGDPARLFSNVNTPEDYARAQHQTCER